MPLAESVLQEIQLRVEGGFENRHSLLALLFESMGEELGLPENVTALEQLDAETRSQLVDAIDLAFRKKADEERSWEPTTDCDRLLSAFVELEAKGIIAIENCGFTLQEGVDRVWRLALAREELGRKSDGYCFFHTQDVMRAVEGEGLMLAFGSMKDDSLELGSEPIRCPMCHGRGFIHPDPDKFPEECPNHVETVAAPPPATLTKQVGRSVVEAFRKVGLEVQWNGEARDRILLPKLVWQRRLKNAQVLDIQAFLDDWEAEIRAGYTPAEELLRALEERAADRFVEFADFGPELLDRFRSHTQQFLEKERIREESWLDATINDRIAAAFERLNQRGIFASEFLGLTIQDGWGYAGVEASPEHRGVAFFHHEDVIDALSDRGLWVAFGAMGVDASKDDDQSFTIGQEIMAVFEEFGVPSEWSQSVRDRIRVAPFPWRRRRWTKAPRQENWGVHPPKPSLLSRLVKAFSPRSDNQPMASSVEQCGEIVCALRDESGFDLRRAKRIRQAWKTLGGRGDAQVGHLGVPHVFLPTGHYTTVIPVAASKNLREEKNSILLRAYGAKKS